MQWQCHCTNSMCILHSFQVPSLPSFSWLRLLILQHLDNGTSSPWSRAATLVLCCIFYALSFLVLAKRRCYYQSFKTTSLSKYSVHLQGRPDIIANVMAMIRFPPTTIGLGRVDLEDFEKRRKRRKEYDLEVQKHARQDFAAGLSQNLGYRIRDKSQRGEVSQLAEVDSHRPITAVEKIVQEQNSPSVPSQGRSLCQGPSRYTTPEQDTDDFGAESESHLQTVFVNSTRPTSPLKHAFYFGGYISSLNPDAEEFTPRLYNVRSVPNSQPASSNIEPPRLRSRDPLPRSPLFILQNLSSSPAHPVTSAIIPRLTPRHVDHTTPSILFSQPARRPRRTTPGFRHQLNSFSFDSSERASAAYEQERIASYSTSQSDIRPSDELNLHDELHGTSLLGSSSESESQSSSGTSRQAPSVEQGVHTEMDEDSILSPQLPLPPPFSSASRVSSRTDILPSVTTGSLRHPSTSPVRSPISSHFRIIDNDLTRVLSNSLVLTSPPSTEAPPSSQGSPSFLERAAQRINSYRKLTPSNQRSPSYRLHSSSPSPSSPYNTAEDVFNVGETRNMSSYRIYNDSLPRSSQPQTPSHLPEARHRSRFHPSFTAPLASAPRTIQSRLRINDPHSSARRHLAFATPSRRVSRRSDSPVGLSSRGFEGLYGGRENGDEEQNWADGVRFNNAGIRLWGLRDARNDGRSMQATPEPEEWRIRMTS